MTHVRADTVVSRSPDEVLRLFDGPIGGWLPVIVGPEEDTWRAETHEGPVRVHVTVHAGDVWVLPDGTHRREFTVQPDRTDWHDFVTAALTPSIVGHLRVEPLDGVDGSRLVFEGETDRRSRLTTALERVVIGDALVRSGIQTLVDIIAERLRSASLQAVADGPRQGPVRIPIPRRA